jgi:hypothetical protein
MIINTLLRPERLYSAAEVVARPSAAPALPGIYAWYFDIEPPGIDGAGCHSLEGRQLLYVGISPQAPSANGKKSGSHIRRRLRTHYGGNAEGSTLRYTLGCLLGLTLGIELRRVGSGRRFTFTNPGEQILDGWMMRHTRVCWVACEEPWRAEAEMLASGLILPLNIDDNPCARSVDITKTARARAKQAARLMAIVADNGGPRRATGASKPQPSGAL